MAVLVEADLVAFCAQVSMASSMCVTLANGETLLMNASEIRKAKYNGNVWTAHQWWDYGDADMAVWDAVYPPTEVGSATMCKGSSLVDFKRGC